MVIVSNFDPPKQELFEGYCFSGTDYVAGKEGHREFRAVGGNVVSGLDGCYVVIQRAQTGWSIGTDARGLRRLFVFRKDGDWAVSSSLHDLVRHLRAHGVQPTVNQAVLRAFGVRKALTANLNSSRTIFCDIELVPSFCSVEVGASGVQVVPLPRASEMPSYEDAIRDHIVTWRGRLETLKADPRTTFTMDLSGGRDSRVVFAFAHASGLFRGDLSRVRVVSQERMPKDFFAASQIARYYNVHLNGPELPPRTASSVFGALANWRDHSLGLYLPVYLNPYEFDPLSVRGHGAGGGTFREIFSDTTIRNRLESVRAAFEPGLFDDYADTVVEDLHKLSIMRPEVDPQKLHYREFRNRFHFGHSPHLQLMFSPLNSILIDRIADRRGTHDRQIYYDLMDALAPGLKSQPYDDSSKAPTTAESSVVAAALRDLPARPGRIFATARHLDAAIPCSRRATFDAFYRDAVAAMKDSTVRDAIGDARVVKRAKAFLKTMNTRSDRPRANDPGHQDASYMLAVAFATGA